MKKTIIAIFISWLFVTIVNAQELKPIKEIPNLFVENKTYWDHARDMDFLTNPSDKIDIKLSNNLLTVNNKGTNNFYSEIVRDHKYEVPKLYKGVVNFKISATLKSLGGNKDALFGICLGREGGYEALQPLLCDRYNRYLQFLVNQNGKLIIRKVDRELTAYKPDIGALLLEKDISTEFAAEIAKTLCIKRTWTKWEVYLNDKLEFVLEDASIGPLNSANFLVEPGVKTSLSDPAIIVYEKGAEPVFPVPDSLSCLSKQKSCFNYRYNYKFCLEMSESAIEEKVNLTKIKNCLDYRVRINDTKNKGERSDFLFYPFVFGGMDTLAAMESFESGQLAVLIEEKISMSLKETLRKNLDDESNRLVLSRNFVGALENGGSITISFNYYFWGSKNLDALCCVYINTEMVPYSGLFWMDTVVKLYGVRSF